MPEVFCIGVCDNSLCGRCDLMFTLLAYHIIICINQNPVKKSSISDKEYVCCTVRKSTLRHMRPEQIQII